jgi:hypothetical protein
MCCWLWKLVPACEIVTDEIFGSEFVLIWEIGTDILFWCDALPFVFMLFAKNQIGKES